MPSLKHLKRQIHLRPRGRFAATSACVGLMTTVGLAAHAQTNDTDRINQLESQNQTLQQRLDTLEDLVKKEGLMPSGGSASKAVTTLGNVTISGFVQASYFYDFNRPKDGFSNGYLWNTKSGGFDINKVKITLASAPAERSGDQWDAGYRVSLMAGQDAPVLNSDSGITGFDYLREAYVDLNVPVGKGLNIKAGELISLLNWESGDGGAANPNFSQGYQWYYTGDGPEAGVQLDYAFTDWLDVKFRVENGLYEGPVDSNQGKGVMGSINLTPTKDLWINLIGFGGDGSATSKVDGGSVLAGYQVTKKLGTGLEFDYFHFDPNTSPSGDTWSIGTWVWYDFTSKVGAAFRAEYLEDGNGAGILGVPVYNGSGAITSGDPHGNLASFTFTLNLKPAPNIKVQPEIRYDATSYAGGFDGKHNQLILGCGASYLF